MTPEEKREHERQEQIREKKQLAEYEKRGWLKEAEAIKKRIAKREQNIKGK